MSLIEVHTRMTGLYSSYNSHGATPPFSRKLEGKMVLNLLKNGADIGNMKMDWAPPCRTAVLLYRKIYERKVGFDDD